MKLFFPRYNAKCLVLTAFAFFTNDIFSQDGPGGIGATDGASDLYFWIDANSITDIISGNNVSVWKDLSGYNHDVSQAIAGNKPNWKANIVNGFPAVTFDGGERLQGTFTAGLPAPVTVFAVTYFDSLTQPTTNWDFVFSVGDQTTPNGMLNMARYQGGADADKFFNDDGNNINFGDVLVGQQWQIIEFSENTSAPFTELSINGNGGTVDNFMSNSLNTNANFRVGDWANSPGGAYHLNGNIAEIILFKKNLSSAETNIVNSYLAAKYNLAVGNDKYTGDDAANNDNDRGVIGLGVEADGSVTLATADGLTIEVNSNFDNTDYLLMGHDVQANTINTSDIADVSGTLEARWGRVWWADVTNTSSALACDVKFTLNTGGLAGSFSTGTPSDYKLIYRSSNSGNWTILGSATSAGVGSVFFENITFSNDGYYGLATIDEISSPIGEVETPTSCAGPGGIGATDGSSNLKLWLNTQAMKPGDNDPLVTYFDYSGNANHATVFDINNIPVLDSGIVNGNAAATFDGDDYIEGALDINLGADATIISVGYFDQNQGFNDNDYLVSIGNPSTVHNHCSIGRRRNNVALDANKYYSWNGNAAIFGPVINASEWNIFYQEQLVGSTNHTLFINGFSQSVSPNPSSFTSTSPTYRIGMWQNASNSGLDGYVAETIVFDRQLNSAERNILTAYLGGKI